MYKLNMQSLLLSRYVKRLIKVCTQCHCIPKIFLSPNTTKLEGKGATAGNIDYWSRCRIALSNINVA